MTVKNNIKINCTCTTDEESNKCKNFVGFGINDCLLNEHTNLTNIESKLFCESILNNTLKKKEIIKYIDNNYNEDFIDDMIDDEIINWVDDNWKDEYDSEYDWYIDHNNGEAEDVVRNDIINAITINIKNIPENIDLDQLIRNKYNQLDK